MSADSSGVENKLRGIQNVMEEAVIRWTEEFVQETAMTEDVKRQLLLDLLSLRTVRWFSVDGVQLQNLWDRYIENRSVSEEARETLFDFYMNGATALKVRVPMWSGVAEDYYNTLAQAITWPMHSKMIPSTLKEHCVSQSHVAENLKNTPWYLFMVLLSMAPLKDVKAELLPS